MQKDLVEQLYKNIDAKEWDAAVSIFAEDIEYERIESSRIQLFRGKEELKNFYTHIRDIHGEHSIKEIREEDSGVYVIGTFIGTQQAKPIHLGYTDEFIFNTQGKVTRRKSVIRVV